MPSESSARRCSGEAMDKPGLSAVQTAFLAGAFRRKRLAARLSVQPSRAAADGGSPSGHRQEERRQS